MKKITAFVLLFIVPFVIIGEGNGIDIADSNYRKADESLNKICNEIKKILSKPQIETFDKSQQAWGAYKEAEAKFRADIISGGGSSYSVDYLVNLTELTETRTKALQSFLGTLKSVQPDQ